MPLYEYACEKCGHESELLVNGKFATHLPEMWEPKTGEAALDRSLTHAR